MPPPLEPEKRLAIGDAIAAGGTCRGIAADFGVSPSTVRKIADERGVVDPFARTQTAAATRAKVVDNAARRTTIAAGLLDDAELARGRLRRPYLFVAATKDGVVTQRLPEGDIPATEFRALVSAAKTALDGHVILDRHDHDGGASAALSMMGKIAAAISSAADEPYRDPNGPATLDEPEGE